MGVKDMLAVARFRTRQQLKKSRGAPAPRLVLQKGGAPGAAKAAAKAQPVTARPGNYARVQRPGMHQQPVLARVVGAGQHGITVLDDSGQKVRVRHEHVIEAHSQPSTNERAQFARQLASSGVPIGLDQQFLKLDPHGRPRRRPTVSQLGMLEALTDHGVPLDLDGIRESASYDDAQALIDRFVNDPAGVVARRRR